ncbi:hypothetical protein DPMN_187451, partial [Dreissena polymorpha]
KTHTPTIRRTKTDRLMVGQKTAPPTGGHVFQRTGTTFKLNQHIIKTNILKKLHEDWCLQGIIGTDLLTKFNEDRTRNVTSRVFTNQMWTDDGQRAFLKSPEQSDCAHTDARTTDTGP